MCMVIAVKNSIASYMTKRNLITAMHLPKVCDSKQCLTYTPRVAYVNTLITAMICGVKAAHVSDCA
jgi:hypothetical protein